MLLQAYTFVYSWDCEYWDSEGIPIDHEPEPFRIWAQSSDDAEVAVERLIADKFGEWRFYLGHRITFEGTPAEIR
ncbi:hypothetical protein [Streptomyces chrestomyceticus]|uniref:Uncharacterized protein n=1 Tax=Streptomyces chrestomyceticus TaxID=68185 RepID=A0ABU7WLL9_9ACTN